MNIDDLTIKQARELAKLFGNVAPEAATRRLPLALGVKLFIRTITAHYTGKVVAVSEEEIEVVDAAWIASDGRFADLLKTGEFDEVEPYPDGMVVRLFRSTFLDQAEWPFDLPRKQK
jgi:hypothetical protein